MSRRRHTYFPSTGFSNDNNMRDLQLQNTMTHQVYKVRRAVTKYKTCNTRPFESLQCALQCSGPNLPIAFP
jgi:hypothetical protein